MSFENELLVLVMQLNFEYLKHQSPKNFHKYTIFDPISMYKAKQSFFRNSTTLGISGDIGNFGNMGTSVNIFFEKCMSVRKEVLI